MSTKTPTISARVTAYESWYDTPRGRWIGETELALLIAMLKPDPAGSLLDVGCGTGWFTRRLAGVMQGEIAGIDPDEEALQLARLRAKRGERYELGRGEALPFADGSFDFGVSVAALCFIADERQAVRELLRVTRRRFALGLLHRRSLLWRRKGRGGGTGAYAGARWHTAGEARALFEGLPVADLRVRSAIVLPGGGFVARIAERLWPRRWLCGAFLCVSGEIAGEAGCEVRDGRLA